MAEICPKCKNLLRVWEGRPVVEGDQSSETPTRVYLVQKMTCVNPGCEAYDPKGEHPAAEVRHLIYEEPGR